MGRIAGFFLFPHPPVIVPGVGKGSEREAPETLRAMKELGAVVASLSPDVLLLITPHAPSFSDYLLISAPPDLAGDLSSFGDRSPALHFKGHAVLAALLTEEAGKKGLPAGMLTPADRTRHHVAEKLDHGAVVPLHFIKYAYGGRPLPALVHLSIAGMDLHAHYRYGQAAASAIQRMDEVEGREARVVVLASGDLSHRLKEDGPYGFHPEGPRLDAVVVASLRSADPVPLFHLTARQREEAGECGLRSIAFLFGTNDGFRIHGEVLSYEAPFGVGYCVARLVRDDGEAHSRLEELDAALLEAAQERRRKEGPLTSLARAALTAWVRERRTLSRDEALQVARQCISAADGLDPAGAQEQEALLLDRAGCFVSLKHDGNLRGCIGTVHPHREDLAREIVDNAHSAGTRDPRFPSVESEELDALEISVDVMGTPEPIRSKDELDPKRYGVIVRKNGRSGLLLPDLEGVDTVAEQLDIALRKGGIRPDEEYDMERFEARRFT